MAFVLDSVLDHGSSCPNAKKQYLCTSVDDISKLPRCGIEGTQEQRIDPKDNEPCGIGSQAIVKTGEVYILWPDNEWAPF